MKIPLLLAALCSALLLPACNSDVGKETEKKVEEARGLAIGEEGNFEATSTP